MTRRPFERLFAIVCLGLLSVIFGACGSHEAVTPARLPEGLPEARRCAGVECFDIDIGPLVYHLRNMPSKEVADQLRDWAVYGTLVHLKVDGDTLGKATFQMAPVRFRALEEAFPFDYGRGRRAFVGDKDVLLFVETSDRDPTATLGRLADRVRMEAGEIPASVTVYAITPDLADAMIHVERRQKIAGEALFGPAYGYAEREVGSTDELTVFLDTIDDVTFAAVKESKLRFGGRRLPKNRTKGVTVEDVAALWQAQKALGFAASGQGAASGLRPGPKATGFSLDPTWNPRGLAKTLESFADNPCWVLKGVRGILKNAPTTPKDAKPLLIHIAEAMGDVDLDDATCDRLRRVVQEPILDIAHHVRLAESQTDASMREEMIGSAMAHIPMMAENAEQAGPIGSLVGATLSVLEAYTAGKHKVQCARYDGPLAGTRVGMNLFYTDLLAKLWESTDYHHSAPATLVPGFLSAPRLNIDPVWAAEAKKLPATRIWFGLRPEGRALSGAGDTLWFSHIASRVFAAGSNPTNPGAEEQPSEDSRQTIGWWDRHFADVADYEQQYHVQNQIIKWSQIVSFKAEDLSFLDGVSVHHDDRFDRWYAREKAGLRYQHPLALRPEKDWVTGTECIDLLSSYSFESYGSVHYIMGGVGLPGPQDLKAAPRIIPEGPPSLRFQLAAESGPGTATRTRPHYEGTGEASVKITSTTRLRDGNKDLALGELKLRYTAGPNEPAQIALSGKRGGALGMLEGEARGADHVALAYRTESAASRDPALARFLAPSRRGDHKRVQAALREMNGDDPGQLKIASDRLEAEALRKGDAKLASGNGPEALDLYSIAAAAHGDTLQETNLRRALAEIQSGLSGRGLARMGDLERLPQEAKMALLSKTQAQGLEGVGEVLTSKLNPSHTIFGQPASKLHLERNGTEVLSAFRLDGRLPGREVPRAQREALVDHKRGVQVYLDDRFSLNRRDFEVSSDGTIAELARSPDVTWYAVDTAGERYQPGHVVEPSTGVHFSKMSVSASVPGEPLPPESMAIFIRDKRLPCDIDGDGVVSIVEQQNCTTP